MTDTSKPCFPVEGAASALIRFSLGLLFFTAGLNKFLAPGGPAAVAVFLQEGFDKTWLPAALTAPFLHVVPYIEVPLGILLMAGLATPYVLTFAGLYVLVLSFGKMVEQDIVTVANNFLYILMTAVGLWFSARHNVFSIDWLLKRRKNC